NAAPHDAVKDVAGGAAEDEGEAPEGPAVELLGTPKHGADEDDGGEREDDQERGAPLAGGVVEDAKGDAAVFGVDNVEEAGDDVQGVHGGDVSLDDPLGEAVEDNDAEGDGEGFEAEVRHGGAPHPLPYGRGSDRDVHG